MPLTDLKGLEDIVLDNGLYKTKRAADDLYNRARVGPLFYLLGLIVCSLNDNVYEKYLAEVIIATSYFLLIGLARFSLKAPEAEYKKINAWRKQHWILTYLLTLGWGLAFAWVMYQPSLTNTMQTMLLCSMGFSTAISYQFCIDRVPCQISSVLCLVPAGIIIVFFRPDQMILAIAGLVFCIYMILAIPKSHQEYHKRLDIEVGLRDAQKNLKQISMTDELTGLANRRAYNIFFEQSFNFAQRNGTPLSLVVLDLDLFKKINDTHGHAIGDICLQHASTILKKYCNRANDIVARIGGEEFAIILTNTDTANAEALSKKIHGKFNTMPCLNGDCSIELTASFGIASLQSTLDKKPDDLFQRADAMAYAAKSAGRNRIEVARY